MNDAIYLDINETALKTGISLYRVRKLITSGEFSNVYKSGRKYYIHLESFLKFLKGEKKANDR